MHQKEQIQEALEVVKESLPEHYDIISRFFRLHSKKESDYVQIAKIVKIYSILKKGKELKGRNLQALAFYLKEGYSLNVKRKMARQMNIAENNLNQINSNLRKEGYLIVDQNKRIKNHVDPELVKLKKFIIDNGGKNLVITFTES